MAGDEFAERLTGVRRRFALKLSSRLDKIDAYLPELGGGNVAAVHAVHRKVHDLCGIGPTLGFTATGQAARACERILLQPFRGERGLTEREIAKLKAGLAHLRAAASFDMQSTAIVPE